MRKQLFFDDNGLFGKGNVTRRYGKPKLVSNFNDGVSSNDYCSGSIFRLDDGRYRLIYFAHGKDFEGKKLFSAISEDGVEFVSEDVSAYVATQSRQYPNEIMQLEKGVEIASIYEDKYTENANERYKMLSAQLIFDELRVYNKLYTSSDLLNWQLKDGIYWGDGAEPLASVFYNKHKKVHTIVQRPFWGIRSAGYKETADWQNFTDFKHCINVDSLDGNLDEIYGMNAFEYDGMYIGFVQMYRGHKTEYNAKYSSGIIDAQLAYSQDGEYWRRSIREPFITGLGMTPEYKLMWVPSVMRMDDGSINIYASASQLEHGPAFREAGHGEILVFNLREDGFICFETEDNSKPSTVVTREKVWHGGELHVNINSKGATLGVYVSAESEIVGDSNALGHSKAVEGYGHEDCVPFSGDSTDWVPVFKNGKTLDELKNKTLVFEIKFSDGCIYSISGDYTDVFNTQAARYRKFGLLPGEYK